MLTAAQRNKKWGGGGELKRKYLYVPFFPLSAYGGRVIFEQAVDRTEIAGNEKTRKDLVPNKLK